MQDIIKINALREKEINRKRSYSEIAKTLLKTGETRTTLAIATLLLGVGCAGASVFAYELISVADFRYWISGYITPLGTRILSFFFDYTVFALLLFPMLLGIRSYAVTKAGGFDAGVDLLFCYYTDRQKYAFAVRLAYHVFFVFMLFLALVYGVSYFGRETAGYFESLSDMVKATLMVTLSFLCIFALFIVLLLHLLDLFVVTSVSMSCNSSFRDIRRVSAYLMRGKRLRVLTNALSALFPIAVTVFSAGILAFATMPRVILSSALLENDIIKEYKTNNI